MVAMVATIREQAASDQLQVLCRDNCRISRHKAREKYIMSLEQKSKQIGELDKNDG